MDRIVLTLQQEHELEQLFKSTLDRRVRARCQAMLMTARGRARHEIAQDVGVHRTTLRWWLQSSREHGLAGLSLWWAPGPRVVLSK